MEIKLQELARRCRAEALSLKSDSDHDFPILTSLIVLPIVGALLLLFVKDDEQHERDAADRSRWSCRCSCSSQTLLLWSRFDPASADFQFVERHAWIPAFGISYFVGVDGISLLLLVLTGFLTPLALLGSWESVHKHTRAFCIFVLLLESAMMGVFVSLDLFLFYVFWDAMLIPMYFLIGIWGYERRVYAAVKFILYTMGGSVLMLLAILGLAYLHSTVGAGGYSFDLTRMYELQIPAQPAVLVLPGVCARRSRSRCRCFRFTRGCPTRTSRRRPPARSFSPACC